MRFTKKISCCLGALGIVGALYLQPTPTLQAAPLLSLNAHGHDVVTLQKLLNSLHYNIPNTKGHFDQETKTALEKFQKDQKLPVTGTVNRETWYRLKDLGHMTYNTAPVVAKATTHNTNVNPEVVPTRTPPRATPSYNKVSAQPPKAPAVIPTTTRPSVSPIQTKPSDLPIRKPIATVKPVYKPTGAKPVFKSKKKDKKVDKKVTKKNKKIPKSVPWKPSSQTAWKDISSVPMGQEFLDNKQAKKLIDTAKDYLGTPYAFGGNTPEGFDCSGYLEYVFAKEHIKIPRTADVQYNLGRNAPIAQLHPGDLVFFTTYEPGVSHCGIYLGDKKFIHASSSRGVIVDNMDSDYWAPRFVGGKKIVQ